MHYTGNSNEKRQAVATEDAAADDEAVREPAACVEACIELPERGESDELPTSSAVADDMVTEFQTVGDLGITVYRNLSGDRSQNRKLPCYFCDIFVHNMLRHLRRKHGSLAEVAAVCDKSSKQDVIRGLQMLANKGTFKYNCRVLRQGNGVLLVAKSPKTARSATDFLPCPSCLQFFVRTELYKHCQHCTFWQNDVPRKEILAMARTVLQRSLGDGTQMSIEFVGKFL